MEYRTGLQGNCIIELVDSICRDSADMQYMIIQTNFSKCPKQLTYTGQMVHVYSHIHAFGKLRKYEA